MTFRVLFIVKKRILSSAALPVDDGSTAPKPLSLQNSVRRGKPSTCTPCDTVWY